MACNCAEKDKKILQLEAEKAKNADEMNHIKAVMARVDKMHKSLIMKTAECETLKEELQNQNIKFEKAKKAFIENCRTWAQLSYQELENENWDRERIDDFLDGLPHRWPVIS